MLTCMSIDSSTLQPRSEWPAFCMKISCSRAADVAGRPIGKPPFHLRSRTLTYAPVLRPFYTRFHKLSGLLTSDRYKRFGFGATRVVTLQIYTYLLSSRRLLSGYSTFLTSSLTVPHSCCWKTWGSGPVARSGLGFERGTFFSSIRLVSNYIRPVDVIRSSTPTPSTI
jgi:hypothetical protein